MRSVSVSGLILSLCLTILSPAFCEQEFALSLAPVFQIPVGRDHFGPGIGAAADLDWAFLPFMGISAGGGFSNLSIAEGSSFTLYRGGGGAFFRWSPFDRWTFRMDMQAGVYQYQWEDYSNTRPFAGGALSAAFHLSPYISLYAGGGYNWYAFTDNPINAFNLGAGIRLNLSELMRKPARVQGEKTEQRSIFPVSFAWYKDNPVATVRITNNEPNAITNVNLLLFLDRYMGQPEVFAEIPRLASGETADVPVTALFNEVMLTLTGNSNANGVIQIQYRSLGTRKETEFAVQMPVYHRNALSWDDDRRAASFVSLRDPAARRFARYAASVADSLDNNTMPRNIRYAAVIFETLAAYGINYIIDPASSFVELSEDASALDSLNYPYQTLYYRGGDCDDLSILYCSMLEVLGIDSAFITIPGHIYCAFDAGSDGGSSDLIEQDGRFWLPVEITVPEQGFRQAWRTGIRQWRNAGEERRLYPMKESWTVYPPVSVPGAGDRLPDMPAEWEILSRLR